MKLGFIGTGKITYSVVTGICSSKIKFSTILVSPRNLSTARKLAKNNDISPDIVEKLWRYIIELSIELETEIFSKK